MSLPGKCHGQRSLAGCSSRGRKESDSTEWVSTAHTSIKTKQGLPWWYRRIRIRLPVQGTRVQLLVREDPTCHGASKPVHQDSWAWVPEPGTHSEKNHCNGKATNGKQRKCVQQWSQSSQKQILKQTKRGIHSWGYFLVEGNCFTILRWLLWSKANPS